MKQEMADSLIREIITKDKEEYANKKGLSHSFDTISDPFSVAESLQRLILSKYSYGPENTNGRTFNRDSDKEKGKKRTSWLKYHGDFRTITDILQDVLNDNGAGDGIKRKLVYELNLVGMDKKLEPSDYNFYEELVDEALDAYSEAEKAGSPDVAMISQIRLLIEYLNFVYKMKNIKSPANFNLLSESQHNYVKELDAVISHLEGVELEESELMDYMKLVDQHSSGIMLSDYSRAKEYFNNQLDKLLKNNGEKTKIANARFSLISAMIGEYRKRNDRTGRIYYSNIPEKQAKRIIEQLDLAIDQYFDKTSYKERKQRYSLYITWLQISKFSSEPIDKALEIVNKWLELEQDRISSNPMPYYYMYVLCFLSGLEGSTSKMKEAVRYQGEAERKASAAGLRVDAIKDLFRKGRGMGQLLDARALDLSEVISEGVEGNLRSISGRFEELVSKKGIVDITEPKEWIYQKAKFSSERNNTLGKRQIKHKVVFYGGFSYEQIIAIDNTVIDENAKERLPVIGQKRITKPSRKEISIQPKKEEKCRFIPERIHTDDYGISYLNGTADGNTAGLSENDIKKFDAQIGPYGTVEDVMKLLLNTGGFDVLVIKTDNNRHRLSLFQTGTPLSKVLAADSMRSENKLKLEGNAKETTSNKSIRSRKEDSERLDKSKNELPDITGVVELHVTDVASKSVKGWFFHSEQKWNGKITSGIGSKSAKALVGKKRSAKIVDKNENEFILRLL